MLEQEHAVSPPAKSAATVIRWIAFIPAALLAFFAVQVVVSSILGILTGLLRLSGPAWAEAFLDIARYPISYFLESLAFVWIGAFVVPARKHKTAFALFWVYSILCYSLEVSNIQFHPRPVSQGTLCFFAISGAVCGLCLALYRTHVRSKTVPEPPLSLPQNPWSSN